MNERPKHVFEVQIAAPPEAVWRAIIEGDLTRRYFFETTVESDWKPGSALVYRDHEGQRLVEGEVISCEPHIRLAYTWKALWSPEVAAEKPSRVTWELRPFEGGTRLTLVHDGFEAESTLYAEVGGGWPGILERMKLVVEEQVHAAGTRV